MKSQVQELADDLAKIFPSRTLTTPAVVRKKHKVAGKKKSKGSKMPKGKGCK